MKCSDISSRLVDFLYEELSAAERTEFSVHLASCPTCAAEVKASSRALQRTRTALAGPLNEDPPARVHANILAAARAAAQPARKPRVEAQEGFFARLWKAPWLIPAMGAAGVATAVFLIKVIKNPEVLPVREPASPAALSTPQPTEEKSPSPAASPAEPQADQAAANKDEARPTAVGKSVGAASRSGHTRPASRAAAPTPAPAPAPVKRKMASDDLLMDLDVRRAPTIDKSRESASEGAAPMMKRAAPAPAVTNTPVSSPKPAATGRPLNAPGNWAEPPPRGQGSKDDRAEDGNMRAKESARGAGASQPRGEVLQARPQRAAEAPSPAPAASGFALPPAPSAPPAKAAPPASEPRAKAKKSAALEDMADEVADSAPLHSVAAEREIDRADKKGAARPESLQERVRKADKLYEEKKWAQAAAAYSGLLVEAPSHPNAPTWRKRLYFAERAAKGQPSNEP